MLVSHDTLTNYLKTNFSLVHHHKYSLSELENMIPWERQVYIDLVAAHVRRENERMRDQQIAMKNLSRG